MVGRKNNGKKNRSRLDISAEILESAIDGKNKTMLMRNVNLSFHQLKQHLSDLIKYELIEVTSDGKLKTTERGIGFLKSYRETKAYFQPRNILGNQPHIVANSNGKHTIIRPYS